jgi:hypothetical protein
MMKWLSRIVMVGFAALVIWLVWQRVFVTDEMRIKKQVAVMSGAVEKGNLLRLSDAVAADYSDDSGMDKSTLLGEVHAFRSPYDSVSIHLSELTVTVDPDHRKAQAEFIAKVVVKASGGSSEKEVHSGQMRLFFRKDDAGWKLIRAELPESKFD